MRLLIIFLAGLAYAAAVERLNLGCYEDRHQYEGDKRDLDFGYKGDPKGMNVDFCVKHCADLGYKYAGVQMGFECWCGNKYGSYGLSHQCGKPCTGNKTQYCGGETANSVYTTRLAREKKGCDPVDCVLSDWGEYGDCFGECGAEKGQKLRYRKVVKDYWCGGKACAYLRESGRCTRPQPCKASTPFDYLGCFKNEEHDRVVGKDPILTDKTEMTVGKCVLHCKSRGFKYAGLEAGHECWCDNRDDFHRFGKYEHCNVQCVGDKSTFCGGGYAISIYSTKIPEFKAKPVDCKVGEWDDWSQCAGKCGEGVARQTRRRPIVQEPEAGGEPCPAILQKRACTVSRQQCPGPNFVGCFQDTHDRDLNGAHTIFFQNIIDTCIMFCRFKKFAYAGVSGKECWCGQSYGKHGKVDICDRQCPDGNDAYCGGTWANSVYTTEKKSVTEDTDCFNKRPVDCEMGEWGYWSGGDHQCLSHRKRSVARYSRCGGRPCGVTFESTRSSRNDPKCKIVMEMNLGCWRDGPNRDLPHAYLKDKYMTHGMCLDHCGAKGFPYAGMQNEKECLCGDTYGKHGTSYKCDQRCLGDQTQYCGGGWANTMYATDEPEKPKTTRAPEPADPCLGECDTGYWGKWGQCTGECGPDMGLQTRYRHVKKVNANSVRECVSGQARKCTRQC